MSSHICKCRVGSDKCDVKVAVCVKLETCCGEIFLFCTTGVAVELVLEADFWCRIIGLKQPNAVENVF